MGRPSKLPKAQAVDIITDMRARGCSMQEIGEATGYSRTQLGRFVRMFNIPMGHKPVLCPHCSMDIKSPTKVA